MCTEVSQQRDGEPSLNGLNEVLHPELTGQRKQQGQETRRAHPFSAGHPLPKQPVWGFKLPGMGEEASPREWEGGVRLLTEKVGKGRNIPFCFNFPPSLKSTPS